MMDPYENFAERYDMSFGSFGEHEPQVGEFFRRLFAQNNVHTVLDCACGTGRHLPLFHSLGCEVFGSDVSESMLAQARSNLVEYGLEVPLHRIDFRDLPDYFRQQFDAVVCLGSMGRIPNPSSSVLTWLALPGTPLIAALLVIAVTCGKSGLKEWAARIFHWRVGWRWYLFVLFVYPLVAAAAYTVSDLIAGRAWSVATITAGSVLMVWVMNNTNQSVLMTILLHGSIILAGHFPPTQLAFQTGDYVAFWLTCAFLVAIAVGVVWRYGPQLKRDVK
jgi:SAM-dependent methyltransferase